MTDIVPLIIKYHHFTFIVMVLKEIEKNSYYNPVTAYQFAYMGFLHCYPAVYLMLLSNIQLEKKRITYVICGKLQFYIVLGKLEWCKHDSCIIT